MAVVRARPKVWKKGGFGNDVLIDLPSGEALDIKAAQARKRAWSAIYLTNHIFEAWENHQEYGHAFAAEACRRVADLSVSVAEAYGYPVVMTTWRKIGDLLEGLDVLRKEVNSDILPLPIKEIEELDGSTLFQVRMPVTGVIETMTEREAVFFGRRRLRNVEDELLQAVEAVVVRENPLNLEDCASHLRMAEKWLTEAAGYVVGSKAFAAEIEMFRLCIDVMIDRVNKLPIPRKMPNAYDRFCDHLHEVFHDRESGRAYLEGALWPDGPRCAYCKGDKVRRSTRRERKSEEQGNHKLMLYRPHWCKTCERPFKVTDRTPIGRSFYPDHISARAALVLGNFTVRQALLAQAVGVHVTVVRVFRERMRDMDLRPFGVEVLDPAVIQAWVAHASRAGRRITLASETGSSSDGTSSTSART